MALTEYQEKKIKELMQKEGIKPAEYCVIPNQERNKKPEGRALRAIKKNTRDEER